MRPWPAWAREDQVFANELARHRLGRAAFARKRRMGTTVRAFVLYEVGKALAVGDYQPLGQSASGFDAAFVAAGIIVDPRDPFFGRYLMRQAAKSQSAPAQKEMAL